VTKAAYPEVVYEPTAVLLVQGVRGVVAGHGSTRWGSGLLGWVPPRVRVQQQQQRRASRVVVDHTHVSVVACCLVLGQARLVFVCGSAAAAHGLWSRVVTLLCRAPLEVEPEEAASRDGILTRLCVFMYVHGCVDVCECVMRPS